jgi:hypothetical protein
LREIIKAHEGKRPYPIENIPFIDYVEPNGNLQIIDQLFDIVLSSHSIEHQLSFIDHLKDVSKLLKTGGYYVILLPDKRFCFDHFIKESTIADIISQYINKKSIHSVKSIIEHRSLICHNDAGRHWNNDHGNQVYIDHPYTIPNAIKEYNTSVINNEYIDVHSLQFTPESFKIIVDILNNIDYIDLVIDNIYSTIKNSCEFFVILKKK